MTYEDVWLDPKKDNPVHLRRYDWKTRDIYFLLGKGLNVEYIYTPVN